MNKIKKTKLEKFGAWARRNQDFLVVAGLYGTIIAVVGGPIVYAIKSENDRKRENDKTWGQGFEMRNLEEGWVQFRPTSKG